MKFRDYCIVVMGNMESVKDDIVKIAEGIPRYIDAKGILLATFSSAAEPAELRDFFDFNGRSFFLFDLDKENSAYHMDNEKLNNHLFGYLLNQDDRLKEMSDRFMDVISASTKDGKVIISKDKSKSKNNKNKKVMVKVNIDEMTKKEREKMVNKILDKGFEKITNSDKLMLKEISELK